MFDLLAVHTTVDTSTGQQVGQFLSQQKLDHDHLIANTIGWGVQIALFLLSIPVAQALMLMVSYLGLESLIAVSAPPLGADEPALRERWKDAAVRLVLDGVATRPTSPTS